MVLSLAACTPTTEKNKTGEVKEPETEAVETTADAGPGVVTGRPVDQDAPDLTMVSVYSVSEDGSKIEGTMDSVETLDAQSLTDLLIQYGVLDDGTKAVSFTTEESVAMGFFPSAGLKISILGIATLLNPSTSVKSAGFIRHTNSFSVGSLSFLNSCASM